MANVSLSAVAESMAAISTPAPSAVLIQARERFADPAKEAAERLAQAGQNAHSALAALLLNINETAQRTHNAIRAALKVMPDNTDADEALSVLELADGAALQFCSLAWETAGLAFVALSGAPAPAQPNAGIRAAALGQAGREMLALMQAARSARKSGSAVDDPEALLDAALSRVELLGSCVAVLADERTDDEEAAVQYQLVFGRELEANHE